MGLGTDCLVAGALGVIDKDTEYNGAGLPSLDNILEGAADIGNEILTDTLGLVAPTTLTKISKGVEDLDFF